MLFSYSNYLLIYNKIRGWALIYNSTKQLKATQLAYSMQSQLESQVVNADLQFLRQLAIPSMDAASFKSGKLTNATNFAQLLKFKNSQFNFSQQTRQSGQNWIKKKGGNIVPFVERIKSIKHENKIQQEKKKSQTQCHFYLPNLSFANQELYIQKNFQFGVINTVQSIFLEQKTKGNLSKRILQRRKISRENNEQQTMDSLPVINLQIRAPLKKQQYVLTTKQILSLDTNIKPIQWALLYQRSTKQSFWDVMIAQISYWKNNRNSPAFQSMAIASLKLVEKQFDSSLPIHYDSILHYLMHNYLGKMKGKYDSDGSLGPMWAISFMLYRAGRKDQFYKYLQDEDISRHFQTVDKSIQQNNPQKYSQVQDQFDSFYNQLIYALKGLPKCADEALCDRNNIDIVWVFLRNVGIFKQDQNCFLDLRNRLYESYKGPTITERKIKNLLYLLAYGQIAEVGTNDLMDQDDFLHFLIVIYHSPLFDIVSSDKKQLVQRRLTEQLAHYIQQLIFSRKEQYIYYMVLIPQRYLVEQLSSIITSSQLIETVDWKYLAKKINQKVFQRMVLATLQKYATFHQNYILIAKKSCELLENNEIAVKFILQLLIKSVLSNKIDDLQIKKGQQFAKDLMRKKESLKIQYNDVFDFFREYFRLVELIQQRNPSKIYQFLRQSNHVLISQQLKMDTKNALQKLIKHKGFQCYIFYIRNVIKAYQIALVQMDESNVLKQLQRETLLALLTLIRTQPYAQFANKESVKYLLQMLEQGINKFVFV